MNERRHATRYPVVRPVKLRCSLTGRYFAGQTDNASTTGLKIQVAHPSLLVPGQRVKVGIGWTDRDVVLTDEDLREATVVRSLGHGGIQTVAIQFDAPQQLALSA